MENTYDFASGVLEMSRSAGDQPVPNRIRAASAENAFSNSCLAGCSH